MTSFIFNENDISQHIVKYGVDIRPASCLNKRWRNSRLTVIG